jgi:signal transduction histidine kinase
MFRGIWCAAVLLLAAEAAFLSWDGTPAFWFRFITGQPAAWLLIAGLSYWKHEPTSRQGLFARAALLAAVAEMVTLPVVRFPYTQLGGAMVVSIIFGGLLTSQRAAFVWAAICCVLPLSQIAYTNWSWSAYAGWCIVFISAGYLVTMFAKHLEHFFETSRAAEAQQRSAIVAERTRFARDLHDTLAQGLTGIMMQLNAAEQRLQDNAQSAGPHIQKARLLASESLEEAQRSVSALRNAALANGTLLSAIEQIGRKLTGDSSVQLESRLEGQPRSLPEECEANLLRIAQEALTNAVRHASASRIQLLLAYRTSGVVLEIADTGRGISGTESSGFGIAGMKERARQVGGQIQILSDPEKGTRVIVTVPNV